jgi:cob(I)alamin adenosyltransferase
MVQLTRIYTRGGDKGKTSLGNGDRVAKHAQRVDAYGTVDEANAVIGLARLHTANRPDADRMLMQIQNDLFDLGADLCCPERRSEKSDPSPSLRIVQPQIDRLEREIDRMNAELQPLKSFILPGGGPAGAQLHFARTVVRRAERLVCSLAETEPVNPLAIAYVNRLSDHLFVLARYVNVTEGGDTLWVPGATRQFVDE